MYNILDVFQLLGNRMTDHPLESIPGAEAFQRIRRNKLRRYPSPERDGDRLYPLASPAARPSFSIQQTDTIFTIGSCFARNVESALIDNGLTVTSRELDLGPIGESLGFAANFYNKYSIHSVLNEIRWALEPETFPGEDIIYPVNNGEEYADLQLGMARLKYPLDEIMDFRQRFTGVMGRVLDADVIIITLGYVETWYDNKLGIYLNVSPPQPMVNAEPERFEFRVLSFQDVLEGLEEIYALLTKHRSKPLKMLLTVSPVPLLSTFRDMDVLVANAYSKSVQRAALEQFVLNREGVDYFPSYEFVTLSNPTVAWSRGDYRHVSPDLVARIMANVVQSYIESPAGQEKEDTLEALLASARMLDKLGDSEDLFKLYDANKDVFASSAEALALFGKRYVQARDFEPAFECFEAASKLEPATPNYLERLITLCRPLRSPDAAKNLLKEHEHRFPERRDFRDRINWF